MRTIYILSAALAAEALRQKVISPDDPHFQVERTALPSDLMPGHTYLLAEIEPREPLPIGTTKPWVKWKQHPKGPGKHIKQAREQKWGGGRH